MKDSLFLNRTFIIPVSFFVWAPGIQFVLCEGRQWRLARAAMHVVSSFMIYAMQIHDIQIWIVVTDQSSVFVKGSSHWEFVFSDPSL